MNWGENLNYTRYITLDINAASAVTVVNVKRSDAFARFVNVTLVKDGVKYTPEAGVWAMFRCEKPDGHGVITDSRNKDTELDRFLVVINNDGTITIELTDQVTTAVGRCKCDVCLLFNDEVLSTTPFIIDVRPTPNIASLVVSTDDFRTLTNALATVEEIKSEVLDDDFIDLVESIKDIGDVTNLQSKVASLTLPASWSGNGPYTQNITVSGYTATAKTLVNLMCDSAAINTMVASGTTNIYVSNNNGTLTAYAIGGKPTASITVQAVLTETQTV